MDIWQILGITATQDETAIKQAYRTQLRDCHPEDNPEGFRALRSAYEQALAAARPATQAKPLELKTPSPAAAKAQPLTQQESQQETQYQPQQESQQQDYSYRAQQTAAKAQVETPESLFQQLMSMLANERLRFDNEHWYQWAERVGQSSLSYQAQLSQWVQAEILNWRWLPGQVISHLWHALEWSSLERGDKAQQQRAAFFDWWISRPSPAPLDWLATQDNATQIAIQSYYQPLQNALLDCDFPQIRMLFFSGHVCGVLHPALAIVQLRVIRALNLNWPVEQLLELCDFVLQQGELWGEDLVLLAEISRRCGKESLALKLADELKQAELPQLLAEHLENWYLPSTPRLALWFKALACQQGGNWRISAAFEECWFDEPQETDFIEQLLYKTVFNEGAMPHTILPLKSLPGYEGALARLFWACQLGSWQQIEQFVQLPACDRVEAGWHYLGELLCGIATAILANRPKHAVFEALAAGYGQPNWFTMPAPDAQAFSQPTPEEWLQVGQRHPLLPDSWLQALCQRAEAEEWLSLLTEDPSLFGMLIWQREGVRQPLLSAFEHSSDDENGEQAAKEQSSQADIALEWAEFYYSLPWSKISHRLAMRQALSLTQLPQPIKDTPFALAWQMCADPQSISPLIAEVVMRWPKQFVFCIELRNQVERLAQSSLSDEELWQQIDAEQLTALGALINRRVETTDDIHNTLILWAALRYHPNASNSWRYVTTPQLEKLQGQLKEQNINFEEYYYDDNTLAYGLLNDDWERGIHPEAIDACAAKKEAKDYVYPACYCIALLANDISRSGFNGTLVEDFHKSQPKLAGDRQNTTKLLCQLLEDKLNQVISDDREKAPQRFNLHSGKRLFVWALLVALHGFFVFPIYPDNATSLLDPMSIVQQLEAHKGKLLVFLAFNLFMVFRICSTRQTSKGARNYGVWSCFAIGLALVGNSFWWALPLLLGHLLAASGTQAASSMRHGWPKSFKEPRRITLEEIVY
ncbi:J domain-containing protein [Shewanella algae]|uniref:J domain-containing protein n=1 Tax=Shewanella algae TaxID=38313 RepID=UPI0031F4E11A